MCPESAQLLTPGAYVVHPDRPDWGLGQVQSVVGRRVTVNFENAGKLLIDSGVVALQPVDPGDVGEALAERGD
jgi:translation initiation factor 6 (eIF-6)